MDELEKIKFGALLHDVGKFWNRSKFRYTNHPELSEIMSQLYVPEDISDSLRGLLRKSLEETKEDIQKDRIRTTVHIADMLASSERTKLLGDEIEELKDRGERDINKALKSVFCSIKLNEDTQCDEMCYTPIPLKLSDSIFPKNCKQIESNSDNIFAGLWIAFEKEISELKKIYEDNKMIDSYFRRLLSLFYKHFIFIPSAAWVDVPDISLYDHIKVASAIAVCLVDEEINKLYKIESAISKRFNSLEDIRKKEGITQEVYLQKKRDKDNALSEDIKELLIDDKHFSLIHGDISGIQKFIYTISTEHALKTLKGRSAFLVLLNELLALRVINELGLPITNILFVGGGHFYILAPYNVIHKLKKEDKKISKIDEIRKDINKILLNEFEGKLYLALDGIPLNCIDFDKELFSKKWKEVADETAKLKKRKFKELFDDKFFEPRKITENLSNVKTCSICNKDLCFEKGVIFYKVDETGEWRDYFDDFETKDLSEEKRYCSFCKDCVRISEEYFKGVSKSRNKRVSIKEIKGKGIFKDFLEEIKVSDEQFDFYLNDTEELPFKFFPLGIPTDENGNIKDFEQIANSSKGTKKLGVLKMDVDNLGKIFNKGLDNKTISRLATLSSMMSLFFEGYINEIIKKEEYEDKIYLIYAGGDDTLAVGSWNAIIEFAKDVYLKFREFTCNNPDITLSAGIVFIDTHYPISSAVKEAADALDKAKNYSKETYDKNRICILDEVFTWKLFKDDFEGFKEKLKGISEKTKDDFFKDLSEFQIVYYLKQYLVKLVEQDKVSAGFLTRIILSTKGFDKILKDSLNGKVDVPRIWRLKYHIVRNYENEKDVLAISNFVDIIVKHNLENKDKMRNVNMLSVAARLADMETRDKNNGGDEDELSTK